MRRVDGLGPEGGLSLIELLAAMTIMSIAFIAILDGMIMSVRSSDLRSKRVTVERVLGNFAEAMHVVPTGTPIQRFTASPLTVHVDVTSGVTSDPLVQLEDGDAVWVRVGSEDEDATTVDGVWVVDGLDRQHGTFLLLDPADRSPAAAAGYTGDAWFVELPALTIPAGYTPRVTAVAPWDVANDEPLGDGAESGWRRFSLEVEGPPASLSDEPMLRSADITRQGSW